MTIGEKLKRLRNEKGLSQLALERLSGVHCKLLSKYENGKVEPTADTLRKIAQALGVTSDYLIFDNAPLDGISQLKDLELLEKFKEVENMSVENRTMIKNMIDALLIKAKWKASSSLMARMSRGKQGCRPPVGLPSFKKQRLVQKTTYCR
ncbi:MAG: helix-turn-helix transcriptional regulator [Desulfofustis sp. PB-SRB1]|nr:helix-turn-helix transcriptional regulator [Desulfofustis sp. PB-SRB1]